MSNSKYQLSPEKRLIGIQVDLSDLKEQTSGIYLLDSRTIQDPSSIFVPNQQNTSVCHQLIDFADKHLLNEDSDNYEDCFWPNALPSLDTDEDDVNDKEENAKEVDYEDVFALKRQTFIEDNSFWTEMKSVRNYIPNSSLESNNNTLEIVKVESPKKLEISGQHSNQQPEMGLSNPVKSILKKISSRSKSIKKAEKMLLAKKVVFNEKVVSTSYDLSSSKEKKLKNDVKGKVSRISRQQESEDKHEFDARRFADEIKAQFSATDSHFIEQYQDGIIIWPTTFFGHPFGLLDQVIQSENYYETESESDFEPDSEIE